MLRCETLSYSGRSDLWGYSYMSIESTHDRISARVLAVAYTMLRCGILSYPGRCGRSLSVDSVDSYQCLIAISAIAINLRPEFRSGHA